MDERIPNTLPGAREGRTPCAFGFAMSKVPAKRWHTRADLYECLARARAHLDQRFREPICLPELATIAGVSPFHFQRLFKEFFGVSPNERQRSLRLLEARRLIEGGMGVTEAGLIAGMSGLGVPQPIALAATFTARLFTTYLPPIWGWFALRWLRRHDYV